MSKIPTSTIKISKATVKKLINGSGGSVVISDSAASAIALILEKKATRISKYAVKRAKANKRNTVLQEDVENYKIRFGD